MSGLDRLWAGWRSPYLDAVTAEGDGGSASIFERILASGEPDDRTFVLWRGEQCFAILNAFPYTSGHLLVMTYRPVADLDELSPEESAELWEGVRSAVRAITTAYRPEGVNVGINIGRAAGAGVPDHLHVHCLPRWNGDTNFMTAVAETRVMPEPLPVTWEKLRAAWR